MGVLGGWVYWGEGGLVEAEHWEGGTQGMWEGPVGGACGRGMRPELAAFGAAFAAAFGPCPHVPAESPSWAQCRRARSEERAWARGRAAAPWAARPAEEERRHLYLYLVEELSVKR